MFHCDILQATVPFFLCSVCTVNALSYLYNVGLIQGIRRRSLWMALYLGYISLNNVCMRGWGVGS